MISQHCHCLGGEETGNTQGSASPQLSLAALPPLRAGDRVTLLWNNNNSNHMSVTMCQTLSALINFANFHLGLTGSSFHLLSTSLLLQTPPVDPIHPSRHRLDALQWHPTPVLLPGKSHGWRSLVGCSPWPTRPRLECLRETGLILRCDRKVGNPFRKPGRPCCLRAAHGHRSHGSGVWQLLGGSQGHCTGERLPVHRRSLGARTCPVHGHPWEDAPV